MHLSQYSIVFIGFIFCMMQQQASGLLCYDCTVCDTVSSNTKTITVNDNAGYSCFKITSTVVGVTSIARGAVVNCQAGSSSIGSLSGSVSCCTSDRCNFGVALSGSFSLAIVMVAISTVMHSMIIS